MPVVLGRLIRLALVLLAVSALCFGLIRALPGDPALAMLGRGADPADVAALRAELGVDGPVVEQYRAWLGHVVRGDLGTSLRTHRPVADLLWERLPGSVELVVISQLIALAVAVPLALLAAHRRGGLADRICSIGGMGLLSLPSFAFGTLLIYVFAVTLNWLPATGPPGFSKDAIGHMKGMILPAVTLAGWQVALYAQILRADAREILAADHTETATLKGLTTARILFAHTLKPASLSLASLVPITFGELLGGAIVVETLFSLPGVGRLLIDSIAARDFVVIQGGVLLIAVTFVLLNLLSDVIVGRLDPRIRSHVRA